MNAAIKTALGSALLLGTMATAQAQQAPTREELQAQAPAAEREKPSRLTIEDTVERGPCALADPALANVRVNFARVSFSGLPGVPEAALEESWRDLAGHEQPVASL
ncbi:MAG TPA: ShlB/FhaC/HecB family hemolysin secretion/activation protein, partial [Novosphingobium sp.]|nr:ShlB/FhaC/HecB family hemolysin secretion/activation protein [Novosphingobium sp.]